MVLFFDKIQKLSIFKQNIYFLFPLIGYYNISGFIKYEH